MHVTIHICILTSNELKTQSVCGVVCRVGCVGIALTLGEILLSLL